MSARDTQIGGDHYKKLKIQPFDLIKELNADYWVGNVIKYVTRHKDKNGAEDIRKAIHYVQWKWENVGYSHKHEGNQSAQMAIERYCRVNNLGHEEYEAILHAYFDYPWYTKESLQAIIKRDYPNDRL